MKAAGGVFGKAFLDILHDKEEEAYILVIYKKNDTNYCKKPIDKYYMLC